jgi:hypothetical protein
MLTHKAFWREITGVWAQWFGLGLAAIPAGLILGILEQHGMDERKALTIALAFGFVLALVLWIWIGHHFAVVMVEYTFAAATTTFQFEGTEGALVPAAAFATAVLAMSLYVVPPASSQYVTPAVSIVCYSQAPNA